MAQTYRIEFKEEACKRILSGVPAGYLKMQKNLLTHEKNF